MRVAMAYTSVSTALNQKESVKAKDKLPTKAAPSIPISLFVLNSLAWPIIFCNNKTIDQNINKMVNALAAALIMLST